MPRLHAITAALAATGLATLVAAGCGDGRIGEIASERAESAAISSGTTPAVTTLSTTATAPDAGAGEDMQTLPGDIADADARLSADVVDAAAAIGAISSALATASSPSLAPAVLPDISAALQRFDRAVASMQAYRVDIPEIEAWRAAIVANAVRTSDAIRAFTDAAQQAADTNDAAALAAARATLAEALAGFLGSAQAPPG